MIMAANLASSNSRRISFIAITAPVVLADLAVVGLESSCSPFPRVGDGGTPPKPGWALLPASPWPGILILGRECRTL